LENINNRTPSKSGFLSFAIAIVTLVYELFLFSGAGEEVFKHFQKTFFSDARGENGSAVWMFFIGIIFFLLIPMVGHIIGFIFGLAGIIGTSIKKQEKIPAVIGLIFNITPPICFVLYIISKFYS
jgi:hypothetical protein